MTLKQYLETEKVSEEDLTSAISKVGISKYDNSEGQNKAILKALQSKENIKTNKLSSGSKNESPKPKEKAKGVKEDKMTRDFWKILGEEGFETPYYSPSEEEMIMKAKGGKKPGGKKPC